MKKDTMITERSLDLLVDGELDVQEREKLLCALEASPAAWRECALRFLEAAALREAFARRDHAKAAQAVGACEKAVKRSGFRLLQQISIAAAFVGIGFGGYFVRDLVDGRRESVVQTEPEIQYPPRPQSDASAYGSALEEGIVWEPVLRGDGTWSYVTRQGVPQFIREAVLMAGHRVEQEDRVVRLGNAEGSDHSWMIPVSETRIIENRPL